MDKRKVLKVDMKVEVTVLWNPDTQHWVVSEVLVPNGFIVGEVVPGKVVQKYDSV